MRNLQLQSKLLTPQCKSGLFSKLTDFQCNFAMNRSNTSTLNSSTQRMLRGVSPNSTANATYNDLSSFKIIPPLHGEQL